MPAPQFERYIGIDYSGAATPKSSLKGLRVFSAGRSGDVIEVAPPPGPRRYWTRSAVAHWLLETLHQGPPTLVGIDHGFSFPLRYFETHQIAPDWDVFLEDFHRHWPTDAADVCVDFVRDGVLGEGALRSGNARWRRECEIRCRAKSVFHFDCQGSVAKSTHSGIPWLLFLRRQLGTSLHFWPFDGFSVPGGKSALAEAYPALYRQQVVGWTDLPSGDQRDACAIALWLRQADASGALHDALHPPLDVQLRQQARIEGWILGVA